MEDVFCKIIKKEIPADIVLEEENWIAIKDIHPVAPVHVLIIPKKHIGGILEMREAEVELLGQLFLAVNKVAEKMGLSKKGFRLVINNGEHGGQIVPHLHVHMLGGVNLGPKIIRD